MSLPISSTISKSAVAARQTCQPMLGEDQHLLLPLFEVASVRTFHLRGVLVGVLDQPRPNRSASLPHGSTNRADHLIERILQQNAMVCQCAGMFAEADHGHLEQAALDGTFVTGMRLDPRNHADMIRLGSVPIQDDRKTFVGVTERHHVHGGADGRPTNSSVMP